MYVACIGAVHEAHTCVIYMVLYLYAASLHERVLKNNLYNIISVKFATPRFEDA